MGRTWATINLRDATEWECTVIGQPLWSGSQIYCQDRLAPREIQGKYVYFGFPRVAKDPWIVCSTKMPLRKIHESSGCFKNTLPVETYYQLRVAWSTNTTK